MKTKHSTLGEAFELEGGKPALLTRSDKYVLVTLGTLALALIVFLVVGVKEALSAAVITNRL